MLRLDATLLLVRRPGAAAGACREENKTQVTGGVRGGSANQRRGASRSCGADGGLLDGGYRRSEESPHLHRWCWGDWGLHTLLLAVARSSMGTSLVHGAVSGTVEEDMFSRGC